MRRATCVPLGLICLFSCLASAPAARADDYPKGEIIKFAFDRSKIFPGTSREVSVYVPSQYEPEEPACLYVNQDGIQYKAPEVFDELIHKKEMPITIGVFVTPGVVVASSDKALARYNRSFEYDGLGDAYARFLIEELLPEVETKTTMDGRPVKISKKGNDRAIGGASSGAICAFTVAWERPDSFQRVFSAVGTYVGLRGGQSYSTLVRKYEPKPIRIFLEDGSNDLNIYGGDWWIANQQMERALTFAGYEVNHSWGEGGHNVEHGTEVFPDAMRWLWKDWPKAVEVGGGAPQLQDLVLPGESWKQVGSSYKSLDALATSHKGIIFLNDTGNNRGFRINADGQIKDIAAEGQRGEAQAFGPDNRLYATMGSSGQIIAFDLQGKSELVAEGVRASDIVVLNDGKIYATALAPNPADPSKVWCISPKGDKKIVDSGLAHACGLCVSPDQSLLYVTDSHSHWVYSYQIQKDGSLSYKQKYFHLHAPDTAEDSGAEVVRCDRDGRVWVATRMGLQVCDQAGRVNCIIPVPGERITSFAFGGENFDVLYCATRERIYSRKLKVKGSNPWEPPTLPVKPRL